VRWFLGGILFTVIVAIAAGLALIRSGRGFSAREKPTSMETWVAQKSRALAMPAEAKSRMNPIASSPEVLAEGRAHWADHCFSCHANNGSGDTVLGKSLYPPAPDMRQRATQDLTDGELFYVIENGIRLTGMPAWGGPGHDGTASWKLVHFIRHLPSVTFEERREMERLNPKGPDEIEEQREQEEFLKGESDHEVHTHKH